MTLPKGPGRQGLILRDPCLQSCTLLRLVSSLLPPRGHLYADDVLSYLHYLSFSNTAAIRSMSQTMRPRRPQNQRAVYGSTRQEFNLSGLAFCGSLQSWT